MQENAIIYESRAYMEYAKTWHSEDSPWKGRQIQKMAESNNLNPQKVAEIGCGAGVILRELSQKINFNNAVFFRFRHLAASDQNGEKMKPKV